MSYGLTNKDLDLICSAIESRHEIQEAVLFGSRAMGNYKRGSDVDLAIKGTHVGLRTVSDLSACLNEKLPLPYQFDVVGYATIDTPALTKHIDTFGKILFQREKQAE